jgi:hypothetical protein
MVKSYIPKSIETAHEFNWQYFRSWFEMRMRNDRYSSEWLLYYKCRNGSTQPRKCSASKSTDWTRIFLRASSMSWHNCSCLCFSRWIVRAIWFWTQSYGLLIPGHLDAHCEWLWIFQIRSYSSLWTVSSQIYPPNRLPLIEPFRHVPNENPSYCYFLPCPLKSKNHSIQISYRHIR